ncbi:hypothetical protein [Streptomyces albicerus]|uniref:hypothetical protein n=1 Tax=Streptomyces albicerus TaxID=2569859 RepID=UPI00124B0031|nr:hypothetical protein [Streptomyces albicerus]
MTHAAPASRTPVATKLAAPVLGGIVYGLWAAAIGRDAGPITGWNALLGVVSAIAFAAVSYGIHTLVVPRLRREARALAWTAFTGIAFGFLYSLTDASVLKSAGLACVVAAGVFAVVFYRYYTTEN